MAGKGGSEMQLEGFTDVSGVLRGGVYALCAKGVVIYVGKSKAMIARINSHRRAWIDKRKGQSGWIADMLGIPGLLFDEIHVRPCPPHALDALEREMIDKYKPRYNTQLKTSQKIRAPISVTIGAQTLQLNRSREVPTFARRV